MPRKVLSTFYRAYMKSHAWRLKARACLARARFRCQRCQKKGTQANPLQAHHLTYERLGHEHPADLQCLCKGCHRLADRQRQVLNRLRRQRFA